MMGLKFKGTYVESGTPNVGHSKTVNLEEGLAKTKGLKNLKIKRDGLLLLCLTNPYRH